MGRSAQRLNTEKTREKLNSDHSNEHHTPPPVPPGSIRISGFFTGSITTPSHLLDISLPISCTVPYESIEPSLTAFMHASQETHHGDDGDGAAKTVKERIQADLWKKLKAICHVDVQSVDGGDDAPVPPRHVSGGDGKLSRQISRQISGLANEHEELEHAVEELEKMAHRVEQLEEHDAVLEIDYEAREALLQEVMQERDELLDERDQLQCELDALKKQAPPPSRSSSLLKRSFTSFSMSKSVSDGHSVSKSVSDGHSISQRQASRSISRTLTMPIKNLSSTSQNNDSDSEKPFSDSEKPCLENIDPETGHRATFSPDDHQVPRGDLLLEGFFQGKVRTGLHALDVALPVQGGVPGPALVGLAHALERSAAAGEAPSSEHGIWGKLVQVLKADLEMLEEAVETSRL